MKKIVLLPLMCFCLLGINVQSQSDDAAIRSMADPNLRPFYHGVASGDPLFDRVIIWTRVTPENNEDSIKVNWRMSKDTSFNVLSNSGVVYALKTNDYTIKIDAVNLEPSTFYYYEFLAYDRKSLIGRTKTTPKEDVSQLRFATVSCSNYPVGYFNVYNKIFERNDIDAVIHLGDYIYEYGNTLGRIRSFVTENDFEIIELADYRLRHSIYKLDGDSRKMLQQYPLIATWDDHESANDSWKEGAENHDPRTEGPWTERKNNSLKAYYEWMPLRRPDVNDFNRIWRKISYGNLADIFVLDTRLYDRDSIDFESKDVVDRVMLGEKQMKWLEDSLKNSKATWKILAQQVMMAPLVIPILDITLNPDQWDGYTAERQRLFDIILNNNIENVVVLTGDIHTAWANDLPYNRLEYGASPDQPNKGSVGVEFVTTSVTSSSSPFPIPPDLYGIIRGALPHIKYVNLFLKGYGLLNLEEDKATNDFYSIEYINFPGADDKLQSSWFVNKGERFLRQSDRPFMATEDIRPFQYQAPLMPNNPEDTVTTGLFDKPDNLAVLGLYPNPFVNNFGIQYNLFEAADIVIQVVDMTGKQVFEKVLGNQNKGLYIEPINTEGWVEGNYKLSIYANGKPLTVSILKI